MEVGGETYVIQGEPVRDRDGLIWSLDTPSGLKLAATIVGSLKSGLEAEMRRIEQAVATGSRRLERASRASCAAKWSLPVSANGWPGPGAAGAIPTAGTTRRRWCGARRRRSFACFDEGAVIRSRNGFWLAIPSPEAPKRGPAGKRITPGMVERMYGRRLRFVYRPRGASLLVMDGMVARGGRRGGFRMATTRKASKRRGEYVSTSGLTTVVMFFLVPQVRMPKRLDVARAAERWSAGCRR